MYTRREALPTVTTATIPPAASDEVPFDERFAALLERGRTEHAAERLAEALGTFREAERLAHELGDRRAVDRAFVNQCGVVIEKDRSLSPDSFQRLREIVMAADNQTNTRLAAYNLARAHECLKQNRKGLFYARIALDRSRILGSPDWLASSHNQMGNFLLAESRFQEAREEYERALELLPSDPSRRKALILTNLGYALMVLGSPEGLPLVYRSLRMSRSLGARRDEIFAHLDLCFGLLELGRFRHAFRHGAAALALSEEAQEPDSTKLALFLLGEAAQQSGDPEAAQDLFKRLQERYFPEASYLPDVLMTVDVCKLINLRA